MSLGFRDPYERRRKQRRWTLVKLVVILGVLGAVGWFAYGMGLQIGQGESDALRQQLSESREQVRKLQSESGRLENQHKAAMQRAETLEERYERDVPEGEMARLLELARQRVEEGVDIERLTFVLESVSRERDCSGPTGSRRFLVDTPIFTNEGNNTATFADGAVTLSALGDSAVNEDGNPEAWFDPEQPLTVTATLIGGEEEEFEGELPLHFSVVESSSEHRFTVQAQQRGYIEVTHERCSFP